eukprot:scaffold45460_cov47-Prasinocladus_malaysianus.AAC.2
MDALRAHPASDGSTPVWAAAQAGNPDSLDMLLAAGMDPAQPATDGSTPLFMAAREGHAEAVARLIAAGCDIHEPRK